MTAQSSGSTVAAISTAEVRHRSDVHGIQAVPRCPIPTAVASYPRLRDQEVTPEHDAEELLREMSISVPICCPVSSPPAGQPRKGNDTRLLPAAAGAPRCVVRAMAGEVEVLLRQSSADSIGQHSERGSVDVATPQ